MGRWLRRVRGALGMGLTWAAAGFAAGMAIELVHNLWPNPLGAAVDIWPAALAYPGLVGGVAFSAVLGFAARGRRLDELSLGRTAALGAAAGVAVSLVPALLTALGMATPNVPLLPLTLSLMGPFALGGAGAAAASLALARRAEDRELEAAEREVAEVGLTDLEARELLGPGGPDGGPSAARRRTR